MQYARHQWDGKQCVLLGFALCAMLLPYLSRVHAQMCSPMEAAKLLADDGQATDLLGISVAISGDVVVAGAYGHGENGAVSGAAYVYRFNGSEWLQEMELLASDGAAGDQFGTSVAIEGDVVVVGAPFEDENGIDAGAAYAYRFDGTNWVQQQKLLASDGQAGDGFGFAIAMSGTRVVIGAWSDDDNGIDAGSAYVFVYDGTQWVEEQKLLASDGSSNDRFGRAVTIAADAVVVGSPLDDVGQIDTGAAYIFTYDSTQWMEQTKLVASDRSASDLFGRLVAISGDVAMIGAPNDDDNGEQSGSVYVFNFDGTHWQEQTKLLASDGAATDGFGRPVVLSGDRALIGAPGDDSHGTEAGAAYLFRFDGTAWIEQSELFPLDGAAQDTFGSWVAMSGDTAVVGSPADSDNGLFSGSAYVFHLNCDTVCYPDCDASGNLTVFDYICFGNAYALQEPYADCDASGDLNIFDYICFGNAYAAGCP